MMCNIEKNYAIILYFNKLALTLHDDKKRKPTNEKNMTNIEELQQLLREEKFQEAYDLCPFDEAKRLADGGNAVATFAVAAYYYNGLGVKQSLGETFKYCEIAKKRGYADAGKYLTKWRKHEDSKNVIGMVTFFEMFVCLPTFFILGIYLINEYTSFPSTTKNILYAALLVPVALTIWLMRVMLKHINISRMKVGFLSILVPIVTIPLTLAFMTAIYAVLYYAVLGFIGQ